MIPIASNSLPQNKTLLPCYDLQEIDGKTLLIPVQQSLDFDPELVTPEDRQQFSKENETLKIPLEDAIIRDKSDILAPVNYQWIAGIRGASVKKHINKETKLSEQGNDDLHFGQQSSVKHRQEIARLQRVWFEDQQYVFRLIQSEIKNDETTFVAVAFARMST
jgi:hypothetical protein